MKKLFLTLTIAVLSAFCASNAKADVSDIYLGIQVGLNHSNVQNFNTLAGDINFQRYKFNAGVNAGVLVLIPFENAFFQTGITTSRRGSALMFQPQPNQSASYSFNGMTLDLPIYAGWRYELNDNVAFMLGGGPVLSYQLSGRVHGEYGISWGPRPIEQGQADYVLKGADWKDINRFNVALGLKIGAFINDCIEVNLTYERYFINLFKNGGQYNPKSLINGANVVGIRFAYYFELR